MDDKRIILYADDDPDIRQVVELSLEDNFELIIFESGAAALEQAKDIQTPNLVLLDVMMPQLDGPSTMLKLKELPGYENLPYIFITAKVQDNEMQNYMDLGVKGVIIKPFDAICLSTQIATYL